VKLRLPSGLLDWVSGLGVSLATGHTRARAQATHVLNCSKYGLDVHWVSGLGITPGHWSHAEPAPHGEPRSRQCGSKLATLRLPPTQPAPDLSR
jgi:hypothetical protein